MKCPQCDSKTKHYESEYDYSKKSGIEGLTVVVDTYECLGCSEIFYDFGDAHEAATAIVDILLSKPHLDRDDIRYVRKHFFVESIFEFAARVGLQPQDIRQVEKGPRKSVLCRKISSKIEDAVIIHRTRKAVTVEFSTKG